MKRRLATATPLAALLLMLVAIAPASALEEADRLYMVGERALVRFDHGSEPVGYRLHRALRQLFLRRFNV